MTDFSGWVAPDDKTFAAVVNPIEIDDNARNELLEYHPFDSKYRICKFQLAVDKSASEPRAIVVIPDDGDKKNWQPEFRELLGLLRFKLEKNPNIGEMLVDTEIREKKQPEMGKDHRWRVVKWQIVKAEVDPRTPEVILFREGIFWETTDRTQQAFSTYAWKPYRS